MAKHPAPPIEDRQLSNSQIDAGVQKLERRIVDLAKLLDEAVAYDNPRVATVQNAVEDTIREIFGAGTPTTERFEPFRVNASPKIFMRRNFDVRPVRQREFMDGLPRAIERLKGVIGSLQEKRLFNPADDNSTVQKPIATSRKVFVVHGHDAAEKLAVEKCLRQLDLEPVILHDQASRGRTIIEKIEAHSDVGFCVVILTPDDVGNAKGQRETLNDRARQNVILELGYFIGKLGRSKVCPLYKPGVELPSDFDGVVYVALDGEWRLTLVRELQAAGFAVDAHKLV